MADFEPAFEKILSQEGGFVDDKNDKGGETKFGISQSFLSNIYRNNYSGPLSEMIDTSDVNNLTLDDAKIIYRRYFWDSNNLGQIQDQRLATMIFGLCVNMGSEVAIDLLQTAYNIVSKIRLREDGIMGPTTIKFINSSFASAPDALVNAYKQIVIDHYNGIVKHNQTQQDFLHGWINRVNEY